MRFESSRMPSQISSFAQQVEQMAKPYGLRFESLWLLTQLIFLCVRLLYRSAGRMPNNNIGRSEV